MTLCHSTSAVAACAIRTILTKLLVLARAQATVYEMRQFSFRACQLWTLHQMRQCRRRLVFRRLTSVTRNVHSFLDCLGWRAAIAEVRLHSCCGLQWSGQWSAANWSHCRACDGRSGGFRRSFVVSAAVWPIESYSPALDTKTLMCCNHLASWVNFAVYVAM